VVPASTLLPEPSQVSSSQTSSRISEHWEAKVSYLNQSISSLRQQNERSKDVQSSFSAIISQLTADKETTRRRLSEITIQKEAEVAIRKDLQSVNTRLERKLEQAEKTETRRSKFLEGALERSKESERSVRGILEKEQLASGALRLRLAGVGLQKDLVETEKSKVKELNEEACVSACSVLQLLTRTTA